jgi:hypothetical protein
MRAGVVIEIGHQVCRARAGPVIARPAEADAGAVEVARTVTSSNGTGAPVGRTVFDYKYLKIGVREVGYRLKASVQLIGSVAGANHYRRTQR